MNAGRKGSVGGSDGDVEVDVVVVGAGSDVGARGSEG